MIINEQAYLWEVGYTIGSVELQSAPGGYPPSHSFFDAAAQVLSLRNTGQINFNQKIRL